MCANARDELLRPGFSGGGGGRPFEGATALVATAAIKGAGEGIVFEVPSCGLALATFSRGLAAVLEATLEVTLGALSGVAFAAALGGAFGEIWGAALDAAFGAALAAASFATAEAAGLAFLTSKAGFTVLGTGLLTTFVVALPKGLAVIFLGFDAAAGNFLAGAALPAGLAAGLRAAAGLALASFWALAAEADLAAVLAAVLPCRPAAGLPGTLAIGLATTLGLALELAFVLACGLAFALALGAAADLGDLTATLAVVLSFFVCAFTAFLLWQAAPV